MIPRPAAQNPLGVHFAPALPPAPFGYSWQDSTVYTAGSAHVDVKLVPRWWNRLAGNGIDVRAQSDIPDGYTSHQIDGARRHAAAVALRALRAYSRKGSL